MKRTVALSDLEELNREQFLISNGVGFLQVPRFTDDIEVKWDGRKKANIFVIKLERGWVPLGWNELKGHHLMQGREVDYFALMAYHEEEGTLWQHCHFRKVENTKVSWYES